MKFVMFNVVHVGSSLMVLYRVTHICLKLWYITLCGKMPEQEIRDSFRILLTICLPSRKAPSMK